MRGNYYRRLLVVVICIFIKICAIASISYAVSEREYKTLLLFFEEKDIVFSPTRHKKPISQTAENVTIITAKEIEAMNAHTLVDVLNIIPGVQIEIKGGPGISAQPHIQGSDFRHVRVLIDGVTLNNLSDNIADIGALPVQNIEQVEIIKGPASSAWGSSLGGVINIITKSPTEASKGTVSVSYGERNTGDFRVETSGKKGGLGYYVFASNLSSDGMWPGTSVSSNNFYSRLNFEISPKTNIYFTFDYNDGSRGLGEFPDFDFQFDNSYEYWFSTLGLNAQTSDNSKFNFSFRTLKQAADYELRQLSTGLQLDKTISTDEVIGASTKFIIQPQTHTVVIGADFERGTLESNTITGDEQSIEKRAVYANDTITSGKWSFTPGIRYDYTSANDDFISPSFGVTYNPSKDTILRASIARGFNIPPLSWTFGTGFFFLPNPDLKMEKAWSYQAGLETSALRYIWLKATAFRHDVSDAIVAETLPSGFSVRVNKEKIRRQGFEIEVKTMSFHNTSLFAGFAFVDAENRRTGETIKNIARYTCDIGLKYATETFKGILKGHYIWWNAEAANEGKYDSFVWDLHLTKSVYRRSGKTLEVFFSAHNLFNASQYLDVNFKNPRRWVEGGLRFKY